MQKLIVIILLISSCMVQGLQAENRETRERGWLESKPSNFQEPTDIPPTTKVQNTEEPRNESTGMKILLWIPNRFLDLIDSFKFDVGVGPAVGGVVRVTKWGQAGFRSVAPLSARAGNFGREIPAKIEHSSEIGVGPLFLQSNERKVCPGEVGAGVDLFLFGIYAGVCVDEVADFVGGIAMYDFKNDDLHGE